MMNRKDRMQDTSAMVTLLFMTWSTENVERFFIGRKRNAIPFLCYFSGMIRSSHPFCTDFVTECPPCLTKMPSPGRGLAGTRPDIDKVSSSQMFKCHRRLSIYSLVGQGEKVVGSHESHAEEGSPLQVEWFRGERSWE